MKTLLPFFLLLSVFTPLQAQDFPKLSRYEIGESGFEAYLPCSPADVVDSSVSDDGSPVWTAEVEGGDLLFGIICVKFAEPLGFDAELNTQLLESYLDYLKEAFEVSESVGYGYGHVLELSENALGMLDYWLDSDGYEWKIKGWVSNSYLTVLYVGGGEGELNEEASNMFLDGIRFPAK
ncbi:MAG: hypothetical protein IPJ00_17755 [Saprospirales bacterium]|nr:hypothetical protein [Saprospirales bacterium]MBK7337884.1 hypothetical protein [Saprospirales bacterium]